MLSPPILFLLSSMPDTYVFGLTQQTLIHIGTQLFNVALLAFILSKVLYKPVREFLQKRSNRVRDMIKQAEDGVSKADALKAEYESKLKEIDRERSEILDTARKQAVDRSKEIVSGAKNEADAIKARATKDIEKEQERAKSEMRQAILEISSVLTEKLITRTIDPETQTRLFNETLTELEEADFIRKGIVAGTASDDALAKTTV